MLSLICKKAEGKMLKLCLTYRNTSSYMKWYSILKIEYENFTVIS